MTFICSKSEHVALLCLSSLERKCVSLTKQTPVISEFWPPSEVAAHDHGFCLLFLGTLCLLSSMTSFLPSLVCNFFLSQNKRSQIIPCSINSLSGNLACKWEDEMWPNKRIYFYFNSNLFPGGPLCLLRRWPNQFYLNTDLFFPSKVKKHFGMIKIGE